MSQSIFIIGGGLIGCACARELARRGARVTVFDPSPGRGAGWAAGGMIGPAYETLGVDGVSASLTEFAFASRALWDDYAGELGVEMGSWSLAVLDGTDKSQNLVRLYECAALSGFGLQMVPPYPSERIELKALFGPKMPFSKAVLPDDVFVNPKALTSALMQDCATLGVVFEAVGVSGFGDGASQIKLDDGRLLSADTLIVAVGARARHFGDQVPELRAIYPIKGILTCVYAPGVLSFVVRCGSLYLIPRGDRIVIGATSEPGVDDVVVTSQAVQGLLASAAALIPALGGKMPVESWAGVRPGSPDHGPLIGWSSRRGVYVAAGWHRNGILLAPLAADIIANEIIEGIEDPRAKAFRPNRFGQQNH